MGRPKKPRDYKGVRLHEKLYCHSRHRIGSWRYFRPDGTCEYFTVESVEEANAVAEKASRYPDEHWKPGRPGLPIFRNCLHPKKPIHIIKATPKLSLMEAMAFKPNIIEKHMRDYTVTEDGCWLKNGDTSIKWRYGTVSIHVNGRLGNFQSHRISYAYHFKEDPGEFFVCHRCDTTSCINPEHLFLGTCQDNVEDMWRKGRAKPRGRAQHKHINYVASN